MGLFRVRKVFLRVLHKLAIKWEYFIPYSTVAGLLIADLCLGWEITCLMLYMVHHLDVLCVAYKWRKFCYVV